MEPGETPYQAAVREMLEETGITVGNLITFYEEPHNVFMYGHSPIHENVTLQGDEYIIDIRWASLHDDSLFDSKSTSILKQFHLYDRNTIKD
ncbi:hypothetical protein CQZ94_24465 [Bacillus sp. MYb209]|nr:hypothetical protein CQZ94_24465 [Bacillus sp. MYb209]